VKDDLEPERPTLHWTFEDYMSKTFSARYLSWSPWLLQGKQYTSFIAYSLHDEVVCRKVTWTRDMDEPRLEIDQFRISLPIAEGLAVRGALKFDTIIHRRKVVLVYQTHHEITCCSISTDKPHKYVLYHYEFGNWDEIAGMLPPDVY
jgi:hypothetical protein